MSPDYYRQEAQRHQKEIARLQGEKARELGKAADESRKASEAAEAARKSKSASIAQSKLRESQNRAAAAVSHQKKAAALESKIATAQGSLHNAERKLADTEKKESQKRIAEQQKMARESQRALADLQGKLTKHSAMHREAFSMLDQLQRLPEKVTVLFVASNPLDQNQLRLDEEARAIGEMIRKSQHREAVHLESRWAARPLDLLQAINECRPTIIHFSGHGSPNEELIFQDDSGRTKTVSKAALVQTIAASSDAIQLVFFNSCCSSAQAQAVAPYVSATIGMNTVIGDDAARVFAAQFYSAIGFGLSLDRAFQQARAALLLEGIPEDETPELFLADSVDASDLVLVRPSELRQ